MVWGIRCGASRVAIREDRGKAVNYNTIEPARLGIATHVT